MRASVSRRGNFICPNCYDMKLFGTVPSESDRDAARVGKKIKLSATEKSNPIKPLDICCDAGRIDDARRKA